MAPEAKAAVEARAARRRKRARPDFDAAVMRRLARPATEKRESQKKNPPPACRAGGSHEVIPMHHH